MKESIIKYGIIITVGCFVVVGSLLQIAYGLLVVLLSLPFALILGPLILGTIGMTKVRQYMKSTLHRESKEAPLTTTTKRSPRFYQSYRARLIKEGEQHDNDD